MVDKKNKILIVDDTVDTVDLLKKRFQAEGYETSEAYDGEEGLVRVTKDKPDLIVLDIMMPKIDGCEMCERLKKDERTRYIPIIMLTAKSEVPDKIKGLDIGADDYITKPFNYKELSARIRSLLDKSAASQKKLEEEKKAALDYMVDEISHEVRNPLTVIGGLSRRILKSLPEDDQNKKYMETILQNVEALEKMVVHLIEIKGAGLCFIEKSDLNEMASHALQRFDTKIKENNIKVKTRFMDKPPLIHCDRENMELAIGNIIENAIESMDDKKRMLEVTSCIDSGWLELKISDTGKGIVRDTLKNIFDPFFTSKTYGPGLGLTFALKTIKSHKGTISVESNPGQGTSFTISLPVKGDNSST